MGDFPTIRVGELLSEDRGISVGVMYPGGDTLGGVPLIRAGDIQDGAINPTPSYRISKEVHQEYRRTALEGGECLITLVGKPGQTVVVPNRMAGWNAARALAVVRLQEPDDTEYFALAMSSPTVQNTILNWCNTTVQPTLNLKEIKELPIPWPDKQTRDAIARAIGVLNTKIGLNRRMNETLETIARAIFKDWFVDFGPTRAKSEGRGPYLGPDVWNMFPDAMDSQEGPVGWRKGRLDDLIFLQRGFDLPKSKRLEGKYPVIAASGVNGTHSKFMVPGPGVATGRSGVIGNVFYIHHDFWPLNTSLWVKEYRNSSPAHAYFLIQTLDFASFNTGSAVPTLNRNHVHSLSTVIPPAGLVQAFDGLVNPLLRRQRANDIESETLANMRDLLLPKLMSGEIRLHDAQKAVEAAA